MSRLLSVVMDEEAKEICGGGKELMDMGACVGTSAAGSSLPPDGGESPSNEAGARTTPHTCPYHTHNVIHTPIDTATASDTIDAQHAPVVRRQPQEVTLLRSLRG